MSILVSKRADTNPDTAALQFPGYPGILKIRREDDAVAFDLSGNFLVRARRHLNNEHVFTVLMDCPTDQWTLCGDAYRTSEQHASDFAEIIDSVRTAFGARQFYLVGTSYGTVSSSFLARRLEGRIAGVVRITTFTDPRTGPNTHGASMLAFDWTQTAMPQLFIHHKDDPDMQVLLLARGPFR